VPSAPIDAGAAARRDTRALLALFAGGASIAFVPICVRWSTVGPNATAFWRMAIALPLLAILRASERPPSPRSIDRRARTGLVVAGLCFAGDLTTWHACIGLTAIANATLLPNLAPIFVTLGARVLFGEPIRPRFLGALAVALLGVWVLLGSAPHGGGHWTGDALGLTAAAFYAGYLLAVQRLRATQSTSTVLLGSGVVAASAFLVITCASGEPFLPPTARAWLPLLTLGVLHTAGQGLIGHALAALPASFLSVGLLIQPVGAALLAAALLGEALGARQFLGGALVMAGIILARRAQTPAVSGRATAAAP
jgi:drug/metabolite transporter (DMT)-like permease